MNVRALLLLEELVPRPRKHRWVQKHPVASFYKPQGIPLCDMKGVVLPVEGLEALRLTDVEKLEHEEAAACMGVSRPTFSRLLAEARTTVANALTNGWALRIEGGVFAITDKPPIAGPVGRGQRGRGGRGGGHGRGRGNSF